MGGDEEKKGPVEAAVKSYGESIGGKITEVINSNTKASAIKETMYDIDDKFAQVAKVMGIGRESAEGYRKSMGDAQSDVARIGGNMQNIADMQIELVNSTGRNIQMSSEYFDDLLATSNVTGVATAKLTSEFKNAGFSLYNTTKLMEDVVNTARSVGVSAQAVSAAVMSNMKALDTVNFSGGVGGLAKMAATSAALRVDMGVVLAAVDKAFDPEGAIEMAASFQRLGVAQSELLDPMRLMNMSRNDPEAFQKAIAEMGKELTTLDEKGNVKIAPGQVGKMKELAKTLGMSTAELSTMSRAAGEMDIKMKKIQFPDIATDEQKQMLANITEMKDGKMSIMVDNKMTDIDVALKSVGNDKEKLAQLLADGQPKDMLTLAKEQTGYLKDIANSRTALKGKTGAAMAGSKEGGKMMEAEHQIATGVYDAFNKALDIKTIREGFDKNMGAVSDVLYKLSKGEGSLEDFGKMLLTVGSSVKDGFLNVTKDVAGGSVKLESDIQAGDNNYSKMIMNVITAMGDIVLKSQNVSMGSSPINSSTMSQEKIAEVSQSLGMSVTEFQEMSSKVTAQEKETATIENKSTLSGDMTLNIKVDAPQGVDTKQLSLALGDPEVKAKIVEILEKYVPNNNTKK
jgi:hypothetical protein